MTTASAVPALIDALVAVGVAAFAPSTSLITVLDGPGNTDQDLGQELWIGCPDPDSDDWADSATSDQAWPYTDHVFRKETMTVSCAAVAWNGDTGPGSMKVLRDQAYAIFDAFAVAMVTDPSLGNVVYQISGVQGLSLKQQVYANGTVAYLSFDITAFTQHQG